jgi:integrase
MTPLEDIICGLGRLAGLRCSEITGLLRGHLDVSEGLLDIRGTKSPASVRGVVIFPELAAKVESWTAIQDARGLTSPLDWFVSTAAGGRVADSYAWRVVKRVAARAGVRVHATDELGRPLAIDRGGENRSRISPHTLRRTYGSDLLNRGARIEVVSAQMGHSSTKVTEKSYAKLLTKTQQREILRLGTGYPFLANEPRRVRR